MICPSDLLFRLRILYLGLRAGYGLRKSYRVSRGNP
jgi:hypothetical protein